MSAVANGLLERRARVYEQAKDITERIAGENRDFTAEEQRSWDQYMAEMDALDKRAQDIKAAEERAASTEAALVAADGGRTPEGRAQLDKGNLSKDNAELRAVARGEKRDYEAMPSRFGLVETRDLAKGTTTAGGFTVPTSFHDQLIEHLIQNSAILQTNPFVLNTGSGENLQISKTTSHSAAVIVGENTPGADSDPVFGQVTLGAFKYMFIIQAPRELLEDTGVDLTGYLARESALALANGFGAHAVTGTGSSQPRGVMLDATTGFTPAAGLIAGGGFGAQGTADQGYDILINVFHSVIPQYRNSSSCYWMMNDNTASRVRKIKDTTGQYVWQPSVQVGQPDLILSKPVVIDPNVASVGANAKSIAFGDFSKFAVRFAGGVRFDRSDEFAFSSDQATFRAILRADAALVDLTGAIKTLTHPAT